MRKMPGYMRSVRRIWHNRENTEMTELIDKRSDGSLSPEGFLHEIAQIDSRELLKQREVARQPPREIIAYTDSKGGRGSYSTREVYLAKKSFDRWYAEVCDQLGDFEKALYDLLEHADPESTETQQTRETLVYELRMLHSDYIQMQREGILLWMPARYPCSRCGRSDESLLDHMRWVLQYYDADPTGERRARSRQPDIIDSELF